MPLYCHELNSIEECKYSNRYRGQNRPEKTIQKPVIHSYFKLVYIPLIGNQKEILLQLITDFASLQSDIDFCGILGSFCGMRNEVSNEIDQIFSVELARK